MLQRVIKTLRNKESAQFQERGNPVITVEIAERNEAKLTLKMTAWGL